MPPSGLYNVFELSTTSTVTTVAGGAANSTAATITAISVTSTPSVLQASNTARKGLIAYSCSGSASPALIAYTTSVSSISFSLAINPGAYWEMPVPLSNIGLAVAVSTTVGSGTATILVTELS